MDIYIGILKINIYIKKNLIVEKRALINKLRDIANNRFNSSFLDLESFNDFSNLDIAFLNASANVELIESVFNNILNYIKQIEDLHIVKEFVKIDKFNK